MKTKYIVLLISILCQNAIAQFELIHDKTLETPTSFDISTDTILELTEFPGLINSFCISGQVQFTSFPSLARVVLVDEENKHYLVYETSTEYNNTTMITFNNQGFETSLLTKTTKSSRLKLFLHNARINISGINQQILKDLNNEDLKEIKRNLENDLYDNRLESLKSYITRNGMVWKAGETPLSKLAYYQKKALFGEGYNTHGIEYYIDGFFEYRPKYQPHIKEVQMILGSANQYIESFDWRKRHGANDENSPYFDDDATGSGWMTSLKCQSGCWLTDHLECLDSAACASQGGEYRAVGTCWAFAPIAATEALVNLYYNDHLDYDLSEQNVVSCVFHAEPYYIYSAMNYIVNTGVVTEDCFPYAAEDGDCINDICVNPSETIQLDSRSSSKTSVASYKENLISYGPMPCKMDEWSHAVCLVGWDVIKEGDYIDFTGGVNIPPESPYIGQEYWILKNSSTTWAYSSDHRGYIYMINPPDYAYSFYTPISSLLLSTNDIQCRDEDEDGYYNWGIGPKPGHCPTCPDERDGDDNDPTVGPLNEDGYSSKLLPFEESFEITINDWFQVDNDDFDWSHNSGSTPTSYTGPSSADDGDYYIYVESNSPNFPSKVSSIISPTISLVEENAPVLQFSYHMYGSTMGTLKVYISNDLGDTWSSALWTKSGDQGNSWYIGWVDLSSYSEDQINVKFEGTTGTNYYSDIAIDYITISNCSPESPIYINSTTVWSDSRMVCDNIIIQNNATLYLTGTVFLSTEASITVNANSTLEIDGGRLNNGRITVNSGGELTIENGGKIYLSDEDNIIVTSGATLDFDEGDILIE